MIVLCNVVSVPTRGRLAPILVLPLIHHTSATHLTAVGHLHLQDQGHRQDVSLEHSLVGLLDQESDLQGHL